MMQMHDLSHRDPDRVRTAPRCYTKPQTPTSQDVAEGYGVTLMLGVATCIGAFIIAYSGWSL